MKTIERRATIEAGVHYVPIPLGAWVMEWEANEPLEVGGHGVDAEEGTVIVAGQSLLAVRARRKTTLRFRWRLGRGNHHERR